MCLEQEADVQLLNYIARFKRNVASLKERGVMKIQEGKHFRLKHFHSEILHFYINQEKLI
jgi:hypothetical protein